LSKLGVLMLETAFYRPVGDIGNPKTWSDQALYKVIAGASVDVVVAKESLSNDLFDLFVENALELQQAGAKAIATSCGFLGSVQENIQDKLEVPFISSALIWVDRLLEQGIDEADIGVMTFDAAVLSDIHFPRGNKGDVPVCGLPPSNLLSRAIRMDSPWFDQNQGELEIVELAKNFVKAQPALKALVLECTNLSPYRKAIELSLGLPVLDINRLIVETMDGRP